MKTITVHQPYAHLIIVGDKPIETRSRKTNIRGRIAIHASKKKSKLSRCFETENISYGAILGTVEIVDCVPVEEIRDNLTIFQLSAGDYSDGRYAWIMKNPIKFKEPVCIRGKQGWWNWKGGEEYE